MDHKDWEMLVAIHEENQLSKAAERLFISQSTLTYRLQQLEKETGTSIIDRSGRTIKFTFEGEYLLAYSRKMLTELTVVREFLNGFHMEVNGKLVIGVSAIYAQYKLSDKIKAFLDIHPNFQIELKTGWSSDVVQLLQNDDVQIGIIRGNYNWYQKKHLIGIEPIVIISNQPFDISELPSLPRIQYKTVPSNIHIEQKTDSLLTKMIDNWWQDHFDVKPKIAITVDDMETCKEMVRKGLGYAIIPGFCVKPEDQFFTENVIDSSGNAVVRNTWLIYKDSALKQPLVRKLVQFFI